MVLVRLQSVFTLLLCSLFAHCVATGHEPALTAAGQSSTAAYDDTPDAIGGDRTAVSANFAVVSHDPSHSAIDVAIECERQRDQLQRRWLGACGRRWEQRCEVVVHATESAYLRSVGWDAAMTRGVSKIRRQQGRILSRHVSLMAEPRTRELSALAHELTHLVLADRFTRQPPRWADEGIALLADGAEKRSLHLRDLQRALDTHCCPKVEETLAAYHYPQGSRLNAFYGQSLSIVAYLTEVGEPTKVTDLVALAMERGYDAALSEIYGIADTAELERRWRRHLNARAPHAASTSSTASPAATR